MFHKRVGVKCNAIPNGHYPLMSDAPLLNSRSACVCVRMSVCTIGKLWLSTLCMQNIKILEFDREKFTIRAEG